MRRRTVVTGMPRPLPECSGCGRGMRRQMWSLAKGKCSDCRTAAESMALVHAIANLRKLNDGHTHRPSVEDRIQALAAKRAADRTPGVQR